jgi:hypothetical protein
MYKYLALFCSSVPTQHVSWESELKMQMIQSHVGEGTYCMRMRKDAKGRSREGRRVNTNDGYDGYNDNDLNRQ